MPQAYYQCPTCLTLFSTRYKTSEGAPQMYCMGSNSHETRVEMTYRGDGWQGRLNIPHKKGGAAT